MTNTVFSAQNLSGFERKKEAERVLMLQISSILPKKGAGRREIDEKELWELAYSIKTYGVVQPVIVKCLGMGTYELIAGERRIKAACLAGLKTVPAVVFENSEEDNNLFLLAVLENVQRTNLTLTEEARAYKDIMEQFEMSAEKLGKKLGKQPYEIESKVEMLKLPEYVLKKIDEYGLSVFHAHQFLKIKDAEILKKAVTAVTVRGFDVCRTENYINRLISETAEMPKNSFCVRDIKILTNTIGQIAAMLKKCGNDDAVSVTEKGNTTEFTIKVPKQIVQTEGM